MVCPEIYKTESPQKEGSFFPTMQELWPHYNSIFLIQVYYLYIDIEFHFEEQHEKVQIHTFGIRNQNLHVHMD